jgi:hypothetical protein
MHVWPPLPQLVAFCAVAVAGMQMPCAQQPLAQLLGPQFPAPPLPPEPPEPPEPPVPPHWNVAVHDWLVLVQSAHARPLVPHVVLLEFDGDVTHLPSVPQQPLQFDGPQALPPHDGTTAARKPMVAPSANALKFMLSTSPSGRRHHRADGVFTPFDYPCLQRPRKLSESAFEVNWGLHEKKQPVASHFEKRPAALS